jgi:hypothetical protein
MAEEASVLRLYVRFYVCALRGMYLLNCVLVGAGVGSQFIHRQELLDPLPGVAFSFCATLSGFVNRTLSSGGTSAARAYAPR